MSTPILGIVGWSGSGKTTLLEYLIKHLALCGKRVNVIKHSHHDVILEPSHKDSARFRTAGAQEVLLASPYRYAVVHELRNEPELSLDDLLGKLNAADLNLVEGYKWAAIPKLEVYRPSLGKPAIYVEDAHIIAIASDVPRPAACPAALIWFDLNDQNTILQWVLQLIAIPV